MILKFDFVLSIQSESARSVIVSLWFIKKIKNKKSKTTQWKVLLNSLSERKKTVCNLDKTVYFWFLWTVGPVVPATFVKTEQQRGCKVDSVSNRHHEHGWNQPVCAITKGSFHDLRLLVKSTFFFEFLGIERTIKHASKLGENHSSARCLSRGWGLHSKSRGKLSGAGAPLVSALCNVCFPSD